MSDESNVIKFPGLAARKPDALRILDAAKPGEIGPDGLTEDQRKAIQVILSGMTFVLIGIKPTDRGADFFTSVHGDAGELRNAQPHLDGVIARAFSKKNI